MYTLFLQYYWWFMVSLMASLVVFTMFVQGANAQLFTLGKSQAERRLIINATGQKWHLSFTVFVSFAAVFLAAFPMFIGASLGGAYWLWMIILLTYVLLAVSYVYQNKLGNFFGTKTYQWMLVANGYLAPFLLGCTFSTFSTGSNFVIEESNLENLASPQLVHWDNSSYGLDILLDPWNWAGGLTVLFFTRILGLLYVISTIDDEDISKRCRVNLLVNAFAFFACLFVILIHLMFMDGYAYDPVNGNISVEPLKYFNNLVTLWPLAILLVGSIALLVHALLRTDRRFSYQKGIWPAGGSAVMFVTAYFLLTGWGDTVFYPSKVSLQSGLTIENASASLNTLETLFYASFLIPLVVAYIAYVWYKMTRNPFHLDDVEKFDIY